MWKVAMCESGCRHFRIVSVHTDQKDILSSNTVVFLSLSFMYWAFIHVSCQSEKIMHWRCVSTSSLRTQQVAAYKFIVCFWLQCWQLCCCVDLTSSIIQFGIVTGAVTVLDFVFSEPQDDECYNLALCTELIWIRAWYVVETRMLCILNLVTWWVCIHVNCKAKTCQHIQLSQMSKLPTSPCRRDDKGKMKLSSSHSQWDKILYKVVQICLGRYVCKQVTVCPGHIWTTLYLGSVRSCDDIGEYLWSATHGGVHWVK
jgi:hypothetical protein